MIYPPQCYMLITGDLHRKQIMIKRGICIEIDILGNHTLRGPGEVINILSAITKHQVTSIISLSHVYCYEFDEKSFFEKVKKFPSFRTIIKKVLYNIFQCSNLKEHKIATQLTNLETIYSFDNACDKPCYHSTTFLQLLEFDNKVDLFGKKILSWQIVVILIQSTTSMIGLHASISLSVSDWIQKTISVMDCILLLDCYMRSQTPYFDKSGIFITDFSLIFKRWLKNYALLDFLILFPFDLFVYPVWKLNFVESNTAQRLICYVRILRFFRIVPGLRNLDFLGNLHVQYKNYLCIVTSTLALLGLISVCGTVWIIASCQPGRIVQVY